MIFHICSHFGDIEIRDAGSGSSAIHYENLTPLERKALDELLALYGKRPSKEKGRIEVAAPIHEVGSKLDELVHRGNVTITAVMYSTGKRKAVKGPARAWLEAVLGRVTGAATAATEAVKEAAEKVAEPVAAAAVTAPTRGCPMPAVTDLKEKKAADVVSTFLNPAQLDDFQRHRSFVSVGCDTGRIYQITSRWSPHVERLGVLRDVRDQRSICASNLDVPPSEEVLSMLLSIEHFENEFLATGHGQQIADDPLSFRGRIRAALNRHASQGLLLRPPRYQA